MGFKKKIIAACQAELDQKVALLQEAMAASREAANNETKSSAGDKYETTRAMMHFELEKLSAQLGKLKLMQEALFQAEKQMASHTTIGLGSLVATSKNTFYLATSLGKITVDETSVFVLSLASPLGKLLHGKHVNDFVLFQGMQQEILSVE